MFDFERPSIEVVEISDDKKYGRFVVEPLERNPLREAMALLLETPSEESCFLRFPVQL